MPEPVLRTMLQAGATIDSRFLKVYLNSRKRAKLPPQVAVLEHLSTSVAEETLDEVVRRWGHKGLAEVLTKRGYVPKAPLITSGVRDPPLQRSQSVQKWLTERQSQLIESLSPSLLTDIVRLISSFELEGWRAFFYDIKHAQVHEQRAKLRKIVKLETEAMGQLAALQQWLDDPAQALYLRIPSIDITLEAVDEDEQVAEDEEPEYDESSDPYDE